MDSWQKMRHIFFVLFILFSLSCGRTKNTYDEEFPVKYKMEHDGFYRAPLVIVNPHLRSNAHGMASFFINGIQFYAKVKLNTSWKEVAHFQALHSGNRCPSKEDDQNHDGFIDVSEAQSSSGKILVPLDGDLRTQMRKFKEHPSSDGTGSYFYSKAASLVLLLRDLRNGKGPEHPSFTKLAPLGGLYIQERVVIIYGIPRGIDLPSSVKGIPGFPLNITVPIACGTIYESLETFP